MGNFNPSGGDWLTALAKILQGGSQFAGTMGGLGQENAFKQSLINKGIGEGSLTPDLAEISHAPENASFTDPMAKLAYEQTMNQNMRGQFGKMSSDQIWKLLGTQGDSAGRGGLDSGKDPELDIAGKILSESATVSPTAGLVQDPIQNARIPWAVNILVSRGKMDRRSAKRIIDSWNRNAGIMQHEVIPNPY